jgi:hypothetical protein
MRVRIGATLLAAAALGASTLLASAPSATGVIARSHGTIAVFSANQSNNWSGYDQGTLEKNDKLFSSMAGDWTVPTATQHTPGEAEYSSTWIGIGGGCVDAGCTVTDSTLVQLGTEQDVAADGTASYSAWWELVPVPSVTISTMTVKPGDHMHATLASTLPGVWTMTMSDLTNGGSFSQTVPYPSTELSAEWIEETPVVIQTGTGTGIAALPNLGTVHFQKTQANGANAALTAAEAMQLVDSNGNTLATPSAPNTAGTAFNDCTYATACAHP